MGIVTGKGQDKELFNSKWVTAVITDVSNRVHFVPIKNVIGDYFLAEINKQLYCFRIDGSRIKVWQQNLTKSFRMLFYDINHYLPISEKDIKLIEETLRKDNLPQLDKKMFRTLSYLAKREKETPNKPFDGHDLIKIVEEAKTKPDSKTDETLINMLNFIEHLDVKQILSPVRKLSEFLYHDLIESDPKFFGTIAQAYKNVDFENKYMTNVPITSKKSWVKFALIIGIAVAVIGLLAFAMQSGMLNNLIPHPESPGATTVHSTQAVFQNYPTPEALKAAITRGDVKYQDLPIDIQHMVDQVRTP